MPERDIPGDWWTLFRSQPLNRLIEQSLHANPDLDAAQAALRQAQENVYAGQGALFPQASVSLQAERQQFSGATFGQPNTTPRSAWSRRQLNISYAPDVFGGTRRQIESLAAQAEYQRFQLEATYLTLTSNVVVAAVQEASLRGQIAATQDIIKDQAQQLNLVRQRFKLGGAVAGRRADPGGAARADPRDAAAAAEAARADSATSWPRWPASFPSHAAGRDIRSRQHASAARTCRSACRRSWSSSGRTCARPRRSCMRHRRQIGVATANQLPQFTITAALGTAATGFTNMFAPAPACGASPAASRRRCSTPARCCTRSARRWRPSSRPRRSIAAR